MTLTRRQKEILDFIRQFIRDEGYSPSLEEIGAHFGLSSVATVHKHVQHLIQKGYLRKVSNSSRSVEPVDLGEEGQPAPAQIEAVTLPLLGEVAAGFPIEAIENPEVITVPMDLAPRGKDLFVLRVRGSSMIEEQIRDGDYVVIEARPQAHQGETVVALVRGEEATLKKFYQDGPSVRLVPANSSMEAMVFPAEEVEIRGVVRGLIRSY